MKVKCNKCGMIHETDVDWHYMSSDERQMGAEEFYDFETSIECDCGETIEIHFEASEYPIGDGIRVYNSSIINCEILED